MEPISLNPVELTGVGRRPAPTPQKPVSADPEGFADKLRGVVEEVNSLQIDADQSVQRLATGKANNVHEVVVSVAKADLSFKLLLELRNKLVEAYKATMSMGV